MAAEAAASLPYHEPDVVTILVQAAFLLLLNVINIVVDRLVYCGLLGQILVGIAWGTPGAQWLSTNVETVIMQMGYLGLILLVYQGGLSTSFASLKSNLLLSSAVALTGIGLPIGLSFSLQGLVGATRIQAFAAGAALCSTSLGTTFTVLAASGLSASRIGIVLTSAAMMDDVVGLVMVQVISNLGGGDISAVTIVRPVLVSLAFAVVVPLTCSFVVTPLTLMLNRIRSQHRDSRASQLLRLPQTALVLHTLLLIVLVAGSSYAGTSNLFAAYIAGAVISWWDSELPHPAAPSQSSTGKQKQSKAEVPAGHAAVPENVQQSSPRPAEQPGPSEGHPEEDPTSGTAIYEHYYHQAVAKILQPFFFASIGFSIPITRLFRGAIVWRGVVYAALMTVGKMACGLWLVRLPLEPARVKMRDLGSRLWIPSVPHLWGGSSRANAAQCTSSRQARRTANANTGVTPQQTSPAPHKPFSLHPPLIIALAMTARGEIGFLISAVAESNGIFASSTQADSGSESDIFLIVTWAIVLCTIIGPLGVGLCVRRVRTLEDRKNSEQEGAGRDVLGVWGVQ